MRAKPVTADEQYRLIMECRSSGLTDYQWCIEHNIKPGTFYNWVKRLRQKGGNEVQAAARFKSPVKQEVVKIELTKPAAKVLEPGSISEPIPYSWPTSSEMPVLELVMTGTTIRIPNGTDPVLLEQTIRILRELRC